MLVTRNTALQYAIGVDGPDGGPEVELSIDRESHDVQWRWRPNVLIPASDLDGETAVSGAGPVATVERVETEPLYDCERLLADHRD